MSRYFVAFLACAHAGIATAEQSECSRGYQAVVERNYAAAIEPLQACVRQNEIRSKAFANASYLLGVAHFYRGEYRQAYDTCARLVPLARDHLEPEMYAFIEQTILGAVEPDEWNVVIQTRLNPALSQEEDRQHEQSLEGRGSLSGVALLPEQARAALDSALEGMPLKLKEGIDAENLQAPLPDRLPR